VVSGAATMTLRVRVPRWVTGPPAAWPNGAAITGLDGAAVPGLRGVGGSRWIALRCHWQASDLLEVTLPMGLAAGPARTIPRWWR